MFYLCHSELFEVLCRSIVIHKIIHNEFLSYITFFLLITDTSMESSSHVSKCVPIIILCFSIGLRANAVTSSLESASISMDSGFRTTATAYNIENSLSVGILCQYLQSSASTAAIAYYCSKNPLSHFIC